MAYDYITTEEISFESGKATVGGFLARPVRDDSATHPFVDLSYQVPQYSDEKTSALVVIFEMYGLADHIKDVTTRLARLGNVALAVDLYSTEPDWPELDTWDVERGRAASRSGKDDETEASIATLAADHQTGARRALPWIADLGAKDHLPNLNAAVEYLKARPDVDPARVGVVGFCMGGGLAARLAVTRQDMAAAVVYYGPMPAPEQAGNLSCPVLGHFGTLDPLAERARPFEAAMQGEGKAGAVHFYEGAPHRFFNDTRPFYQAPAAELSWQRTVEFLQQHLGD